MAHFTKESYPEMGEFILNQNRMYMRFLERALLCDILILERNISRKFLCPDFFLSGVQGGILKLF